MRNFPLLPFWVSIAPMVLRVGGLTHPKFGMVVDLSSFLDKFFCFPIKLRSSKLPQSEDDQGQNLGHFTPCNKGGQHGSNVSGYFMSSAGDTTVGIISAAPAGPILICKFQCQKKKKRKKHSSSIYRPARPADAGPGGLNKIR